MAREAYTKGGWRKGRGRLWGRGPAHRATGTYANRHRAPAASTHFRPLQALSFLPITVGTSGKTALDVAKKYGEAGHRLVTGAGTEGRAEAPTRGPEPSCRAAGHCLKSRVPRGAKKPVHI